MDRGEQVQQAVDVSGNRYDVALARFQGGEITRIFEETYQSLIEKAKESGNESVSIAVADSVGDRLVLSPEQQAYVDSMEELLLGLGYSVEETEQYVEPDGNITGNRTHLHLVITFEQ